MAGEIAQSGQFEGKGGTDDSGGLNNHETVDQGQDQHDDAKGDVVDEQSLFISLMDIVNCVSKPDRELCDNEDLLTPYWAWCCHLYKLRRSQFASMGINSDVNADINFDGKYLPSTISKDVVMNLCMADRWTVAMTARMAMESFGIISNVKDIMKSNGTIERKECIEIHFVGSSELEESAVSGFEKLWLHEVPDVRNFKVGLVGPRDFERLMTYDGNGGMRLIDGGKMDVLGRVDDDLCLSVPCCGDCVGNDTGGGEGQRGVYVCSADRTYDSFLRRCRKREKTRVDGTRDTPDSKYCTSKPDLVMVLNSGIHEHPFPSTWGQTVKELIDLDVPVVFTAYNEEEVRQDQKIVESQGANIVITAQENPWKSPIPIREPFFKDEFYYKNGFMFAFKGRPSKK
ncbi:hypothetical protein HDU76_003402 [Blyttiomyces sp. JEL0837]|nr:hypothetical protein HDU76_003402 [Blyttiomyces sp. JEL0837]